MNGGRADDALGLFGDDALGLVDEIGSDGIDKPFLGLGGANILMTRSWSISLKFGMKRFLLPAHFRGS